MATSQAWVGDARKAEPSDGHGAADSAFLKWMIVRGGPVIATVRRLSVADDANQTLSRLPSNRWSLSISTTGCAVLFTLGTYQMIEEQRFAMAALFMFFAFCVPLYLEAMREKLLKHDFRMKRDAKTVDQSGDAEG